MEFHPNRVEKARDDVESLRLVRPEFLTDRGTRSLDQQWKSRVGLQGEDAMPAKSGILTIERCLGPEGRVAVVRFDRGDRVNALSPEAMRQLRDAARSFEDDLATSVVVLTGNAHAFSAGFDLKDGERRTEAAKGLAEQRRSVRVGPSMCRAWAEMEQVTICAIEGFAIGGGAALAVSTDFRILGQGAHIRIPEIALGLNMSWGSIPRILQLIADFT